MPGSACRLRREELLRQTRAGAFRYRRRRPRRGAFSPGPGECLRSPNRTRHIRPYLHRPAARHRPQRSGTRCRRIRRPSCRRAAADLPPWINTRPARRRRPYPSGALPPRSCAVLARRCLVQIRSYCRWGLLLHIAVSRCSTSFLSDKKGTGHADTFFCNATFIS